MSRAISATSRREEPFQSLMYIRQLPIYQIIRKKTLARLLPWWTRATCASYKNDESSRRWESSFARVTSGLRVKEPPANQLPKQRPKLIFPAHQRRSSSRARARVCERRALESRRVASLDVQRYLMEDRLTRRYVSTGAYKPAAKGSCWKCVVARNISRRTVKYYLNTYYNIK